MWSHSRLLPHTNQVSCRDTAGLYQGATLPPCGGATPRREVAASTCLLHVVARLRRMERSSASEAQRPEPGGVHILHSGQTSRTYRFRVEQTFRVLVRLRGLPQGDGDTCSYPGSPSRRHTQPIRSQRGSHPTVLLPRGRYPERSLSLSGSSVSPSS